MFPKGRFDMKAFDSLFLYRQYSLYKNRCEWIISLKKVPLSG